MSIVQTWAHAVIFAVKSNIAARALLARNGKIRIRLGIHLEAHSILSQKKIFSWHEKVAPYGQTHVRTIVWFVDNHFTFRIIRFCSPNLALVSTSTVWSKEFITKVIWWKTWKLCLLFDATGLTGKRFQNIHLASICIIPTGAGVQKLDFESACHITLDISSLGLIIIKAT